MTKYCQNCGAPSSAPTANFCHKCGEPYVKSAARTKTTSSRASVQLDDDEDLSDASYVPDIDGIQVTIDAENDNPERFGNSFTISPNGQAVSKRFKASRAKHSL